MFGVMDHLEHLMENRDANQKKMNVSAHIKNILQETYGNSPTP